MSATLGEIVADIARPFRKGERVTYDTTNPALHITHVYDMPPSAEIGTLVPVDVHFMVVGVDKAEAEARRGELIALLNDWPHPERLAGGPSYIEVGAELGSQDLALALFAVGEVLGLWRVITPERLGITGAEADQLAGNGLVMISGYRRA